MSSPENPRPNGMSRRTIGKIGLAGLTLPLLAHELDVARNGYFEISEAQVLPLYERHDLGPYRMPSRDTSVVFIESPPAVVSMRDSDEILHNLTHSSPINGQIPTPGRQRLVEFSHANHIDLAVGDIVSLELIKKRMLEYDLNKDISKIVLGVGIILGSKLTSEAKTALLPKVDPNDRRSFFRGAASVARAAANVAGGWIITDSELVRTGLPFPLTYNDNVLFRIMARVSDLADISHPPDTVLSFPREIIMALKIKQLGKYYGKAGQPKPLISYVVGAGHSGIEDFLRLPEPMLVSMLRQYDSFFNTKFLTSTVQEFGDDLAALSIIRSSSNGTWNYHEKIYNGELLNLVDLYK